MNFLELCQKVNQFGFFQGSITSVNATGFQETLVDAVRKTWVEIQNERNDWKFLRRNVDISVDTSTTIYTPTTIFGDTETLGTWDIETILYDYTPLTYVPYDEYIQIDLTKSSGEPSYFSIRPEDDALLFNTLDNSYTVTAYYNKAPQYLSANTEEPSLPYKHHWVIVYGALVELAVSINNPELYQRHSMLYSKAMGQLMRDQNKAKSIKQRPLV